MKIVFCNGQPKSGSTFCFELVKRLVPHRVLQATDPEIRAAVAGCEQASRILYMSGGEYTGYVRGSIARASRTLAELALPADTVLVVKTHDASPVAASLLPVPAVVITTFRDPIDVMVALRDQCERERLKPGADQRPGFLRHDNYGTALAHASQFTAGLVASFTSANWYLEYPAFIRPSTDGVACLASLLETDAARVSDVMEQIDHDIRAGKTDGEFNRGEVGRGRGIIEELVRTGQVPLILARAAVEAHHELVRRVEEHGCGITASRCLPGR